MVRCDLVMVNDVSGARSLQADGEDGGDENLRPGEVGSSSSRERVVQGMKARNINCADPLGEAGAARRTRIVLKAIIRYRENAGLGGVKS